MVFRVRCTVQHMDTTLVLTEPPKARTGLAGAYNRQRFAALRAEGKTARQIGRELDFTDTYVRRQLRQFDQESGRKSA